MIFHAIMECMSTRKFFKDQKLHSLRSLRLLLVEKFTRVHLFQFALLLM